MSRTIERRSTELPAHARPRTGVNDGPGASSSRPHLPGEPLGGVGQGHDELGRRAGGKQPFDGTDDADRSDGVPAVIEDRRGNLALADHRLMSLRGEARHRNPFEGERQRMRVDDRPSGEPLERPRHERPSPVGGQVRGLDLPERRRVPGNRRADLEDLHRIVRTEDMVDHQHPPSVEHADPDRFSDPLRQRVRPDQGAPSQLMMVQERVAELEHLGAQPILPRLRILLHQILPLERAQQTVDGRLGEPEALGELADPEAGRAGSQRLQDPCGSVDRLDRGVPAVAHQRSGGASDAARSSAPNSSDVEAAPGSWWPTLRAPRYDARPFRASIGVVRAAPCSAATRAAWSAATTPAEWASRSARSAGVQASTMVLSPSSAAPSLTMPANASSKALVSSGSPKADASPRERPASRRAVPYRGPAAPPTRSTSVAPAWTRSSPGDRPSAAATTEATAANPRSMLTPWSASPIAASSWVRKSRCAAISAAEPRSQRATNAASNGGGAPRRPRRPALTPVVTAATFATCATCVKPAYSGAHRERDVRRCRTSFGFIASWVAIRPLLFGMASGPIAPQGSVPSGPPRETRRGWSATWQFRIRTWARSSARRR